MANQIWGRKTELRNRGQNRGDKVGDRFDSIFQLRRRSSEQQSAFFVRPIFVAVVVTSPSVHFVWSATICCWSGCPALRARWSDLPVHALWSEQLRIIRSELHKSNFLCSLINYVLSRRAKFLFYEFATYIKPHKNLHIIFLSNFIAFLVGILIR